MKHSLSVINSNNDGRERCRDLLAMSKVQSLVGRRAAKAIWGPDDAEGSGRGSKRRDWAGVVKTRKA